MAKQPRITRTMYGGLRPFPPQSPDSFPQKAIEKMARRIDKILTDSQIPDKKNNWIITQALLAVSLRQAATNEEKSRIFREINKHIDEGHRLGLSETDIGAINRVVRQKGQPEQLGQLESFRQRLLARREDQ